MLQGEWWIWAEKAWLTLLLFARLSWLKCGKQLRSLVNRGYTTAGNHSYTYRGVLLAAQHTLGKLCACCRSSLCTVPGHCISAGEAAGIAVVQEHPEFKKALRASKANASSCMTFCSFYLSALFINLKIHTMHHVALPWLLLSQFFSFFCYRILNLPKPLSVFPSREPFDTFFFSCFFWLP